MLRRSPQKPPPGPAKKPDYLLYLLFFLAFIGILAIVLILVFKKDPAEPGQEEVSSFITMPDVRNMRWLSYGDSITDGGYWQAAVADYFALNHIESGISGSCVGGPLDNAFCSDARLAQVYESDAQLITILGGTNDFYSDLPLGEASELSKPLEDKNRMTFYGAYSYLVESLRKNLPEAEIVIMTTPVNHTWFIEDYLNAEGLSIMDYANVSAEIARYYSLALVDLREIYPSAEEFAADFADGIHPNLQGAEKISRALIERMTLP